MNTIIRNFNGILYSQDIFVFTSYSHTRVIKFVYTIQVNEIIKITTERSKGANLKITTLKSVII